MNDSALSSSSAWLVLMFPCINDFLFPCLFLALFSLLPYIHILSQRNTPNSLQTPLRGYISFSIFRALFSFAHVGIETRSNPHCVLTVHFFAFPVPFRVHVRCFNLKQCGYYLIDDIPTYVRSYNGFACTVKKGPSTPQNDICA